MNIRYYALLIFSLIFIDLQSIFRTNVLQPYNIALQPDPYNETHFSFQLGYEGILSSRGFTPHVDGHHNVLKLYQCEQDAVAAFKGFAPETMPGQYAQIFNINDDNTTHGFFTPSGTLSVPLNGMLAAQVRLAHNVSLHGYIPFLHAELKDVCWKERNSHVEFEDNNLPSILSVIQDLGGMNLVQGWKRSGFGDMVIFVKWQNDFWQMKPLLRNVRLSVRGGLNLPTGKKEDICELLGLPFGYDQGYGVYFAGFLALHMVHNWRFMLDLEFLQLFGNTKTRRVKTDEAQTDLFLISKERVYVDPGFTQQYTFMLEKRNIFHGLSSALYYQYFKHNDDVYYPTSNIGNFFIINDAQSVQEYTTHQFLFKLNYEFNHEKDCGSRPNLMILGKYGFNGKRAIVTSSLTAQFTYAF